MPKALHPAESRGYFGVALWLPKYEINIGSVLRGAVAFGAKFVIVVGERYRRQRSDTPFAEQCIPFFQVADEAGFWRCVPTETHLVALELRDDAKPLPSFDHPVRAIYVFGPEDGAVPDTVIAQAKLVQIPGRICLNLACAATALMYDRIAKRARQYRRMEAVA